MVHIVFLYFVQTLDNEDGKIKGEFRLNRLALNTQISLDIHTYLKVLRFSSLSLVLKIH